MRRRVFLGLAALLLPALLTAKPSKAEVKADIRWGTFNVRYKNDNDAKQGVGWDVRKDRIAQYVKNNNIDVVGMQEVTHPQLLDLVERLPEYDYVGVGRTDGKTKGEYSPVFFRKDKYEALEKGNFWLSETPDVPGSKGWDAALERIASYVKLRDKATGKIFMAVNTHFDHVGVEARKQSALLIMKKIQEIVGDKPAVVTGDFNVEESNEAYQTMVSSPFRMYDAYHRSLHHTGTTFTFHDFGKIHPLKCGKIDFIFITPGIHVERTHIEPPHYDAHLSDHNPHWADLEF